MKGQKQLFSSKSDQWSTPISLYNQLNKEFNFTLDPCAMEGNLLNAPKFYTETDNGLRDWINEIAFVNPPYSDIKKWVKHCSEQTTSKVVLLIPARTETKYWHDYIFPVADSILFFKGRLKFGNQTNSAPFPSALVGYNCNFDNFTHLGRVINLENK